MFPSLAVIKERLLETIGKFRRENATNPDKAMSAVELGLPSEFEWLMQGPLRQLGVFVEVDGKYYLSEKRAKEVEKNFDKIAEDFLVDRALSPPPRFRYWMRHTASVPKGFLRSRTWLPMAPCFPFNLRHYL